MIIHGDCLEEMRKMADNSISAIVTDPPYGLSFMGKGWDNAVPGIDYWKSCLRVLKPGGFLLAMGGTRTFHRLALSIEESGFDIRDTIMWIYGSGFPKSHNRFGLEGYGTALKPAYEPIIVAMKPLDGTFKQNAEKWGQAGINISDCRIGTDLIPNSNDHTSHQKWKEQDGRTPKEIPKGELTYSKGRWPANVIFDEEAGALLDEQSGMGASRFFYCAKASSRERNEGLESDPQTTDDGRQKSIDNAYQRGETLRRNHHPTVKPLKLMEYLIKLVMPPKDGLLLDPFAGSGTTVLAAKRLGFDAIGIEKQAEYCEIAKARIAGFSLEKAPQESQQLFDFEADEAINAG